MPNLCTLEAKFEESVYELRFTFVIGVKFALFDRV